MRDFGTSLSVRNTLVAADQRTEVCKAQKALHYKPNGLGFESRCSN